VLIVDHFKVTLFPLTIEVGDAEITQVGIRSSCSWSGGFGLSPQSPQPVAALASLINEPILVVKPNTPKAIVAKTIAIEILVKVVVINKLISFL